MFEPNPNFWPELMAEIADAVDDTLERAADKARSRARPVVAESIEVIRSGIGEDVGGAIHVTSELGRIFTHGTKERYTRSGAYRGHIDAEPVLEQALEEEAAQGLNLTF